MSYYIPKVFLLLLIFIFSIVGLPQSVAAVNYYSPNDTLKDHGIDDVEWVEFGTGDVAWKTTSMDSQYTGTPVEVPVLNESREYAPVPYVIKVNDLDLGLKMADISIAKAEAGAKPVNEVLFLDNGTGGTGENLTGVNGENGENLTEEKSNWCQIDHELKVEITGINEDGQGTPHAQFKYYKRGNPKLEIVIESSTETYKEVSVGAENYFPGRDKDIIIRVKNSGDSWAESIKLDVDFVGFDLTGNRTNLSESDVEINSRRLYTNLGWMAKGEERSINFTVKAPAWDKTSSPFEMDPCNITAIALGIVTK